MPSWRANLAFTSAHETYRYITNAKFNIEVPEGVVMFPHLKRKLGAEPEQVVNKENSQAVYVLGLDDGAMSEHIRKAMMLTVCPEQMVMSGMEEPNDGANQGPRKQRWR